MSNQDKIRAKKLARRFRMGGHWSMEECGFMSVLHELYPDEYYETVRWESNE